MPLNRADLVHAAASVATDGTSVVARNCTTARTGAGVDTITVPDIDATECLVIATVRGATNVALQVVQTSDTVKTVNALALAAGQAATDAAFDVLVLRIASGTFN